MKEEDVWRKISKEEEFKVLILKGHKGWVNSVAFSPNSQLLASGSDDETIMVCDFKEVI